MAKNIDLSIIIPMHNEEGVISDTIIKTSNMISEFKGTWELLLINDGSTDNTLSEAQKFSSEKIRVISYQENFGIGKALRTGFENANGNVIVTLDADLSYSTKYVLEIYKILDEDKSIDFIIGSPYIRGGGTRKVSLYRLLLSKVGNKILSLSFGREISVASCILRGYRKDVIDSIDIESDGKEIHLEILSKLLAIGYCFKEMPATLEGRKSGKSKFKLIRTLYTHIQFSFFQRPILLFGVLGTLILIAGLIGGVYITILRYKKLLNPGRPLISLVVILIIGGLQILSFGFIAIQISVLKKEIYKIRKETNLIKKRWISIND